MICKSSGKSDRYHSVDAAYGNKAVHKSEPIRVNADDYEDGCNERKNWMYYH